MAADLEAVLLDLLRKRPQGWKEYELLLALEARGQPGFEREGDRSRLGLYRRHFRLFHALYMLRDRLHGEAASDLHVHCLDIRLRAYRNPEAWQPAERDGLREHYRDLDRGEALTEAEVEALIAGGLRRSFARERRTEALAALGLADPVSDSEIRRRFRTLALEHHPDLGGDPQRFQQISAAVSWLR